jgi:hypothetical protein
MPAVMKSLKLWSLLLIVAGYVLLPRVLPPRVAQERGWRSEGWNWFGHSGWAPFGFAVGLLILLCTVRYLIERMNSRAGDSVVWYCLALSVFVPAIWLLVVTDWDNEAVSRIACWVGVPIALLFVPSAIFCADLLMGPPAPGVYTLRSVLEIVVLVPNCLYFWILIELFVLGWWGF